MKKHVLAAIAGAGLAAVALTGCATDPNDVTLHDVTWNMTPEVLTLNQRPEDVYRHMAYTNDVNGRMFFEDWGRFWYTDHPSRLNPIEIVSISGKPH